MTSPPVPAADPPPPPLPLVWYSAGDEHSVFFPRELRFIIPDNLVLTVRVLVFANSVCIFVCLLWGKDWVWHTTKKPRSVKSPYMIMELNQSHHLLLGYYYNQSPSPLISQFGQEASSKKSPGCSKLPPFKITEATVCEPSMQQTKFLTPPQILFWKEVFYSHKGCISFIKNTVKTAILWFFFYNNCFVL